MTRARTFHPLGAVRPVIVPRDGPNRIGDSGFQVAVCSRCNHVARGGVTENLYVATAGLIPTPLAVNPTLTGAALAIRTADHVPAD